MQAKEKKKAVEIEYPADSIRGCRFGALFNFTPSRAAVFVYVVSSPASAVLGPARRIRCRAGRPCKRSGARLLSQLDPWLRNIGTVHQRKRRRRESGGGRACREEKSGGITACTVLLMLVSAVEWNCRKISIPDVDNAGDALGERQIVATSKLGQRNHHHPRNGSNF